MARTKRPRKRRQSKSLAITQILMLTGILAMMLIFRQHIGDTMSTLISSLGEPASDVSVGKKDAPEQSKPPEQNNTNP